MLLMKTTGLYQWQNKEKTCTSCVGAPLEILVVAIILFAGDGGIMFVQLPLSSRARFKLQKREIEGGERGN
jgi:hypothetical protein